MTTYLVLTLAVLGSVAVVCLPVLRRLPRRPIVVTAAVLVVLTAVFDSLIVAHGLTVYRADRITGWYVGRAPIEDFTYALAAVLLMPALWTWLGRAGARRRSVR